MNVFVSKISSSSLWSLNSLHCPLLDRKHRREKKENFFFFFFFWLQNFSPSLFEIENETKNIRFFAMQLILGCFVLSELKNSNGIRIRTLLVSIRECFNRRCFDRMDYFAHTSFSALFHQLDNLLMLSRRFSVFCFVLFCFYYTKVVL